MQQSMIRKAIWPAILAGSLALPAFTQMGGGMMGGQQGLGPGGQQMGRGPRMKWAPEHEPS